MSFCAAKRETLRRVTLNVQSLITSFTQNDSRFSTQYYDIGFSVEMNGAVKVPYTRCASHKAAVCGTLEVTDPSICVLKWDNSYAKCKFLPMLRFCIFFAGLVFYFCKAVVILMD